MSPWIQNLTLTRHTETPTISRDSLSFCGFAWAFTLLPSEQTQTSIQHARPFTSTLWETSRWSHRMIRLRSVSPISWSYYSAVTQTGDSLQLTYLQVLFEVMWWRVWPWASCWVGSLRWHIGLRAWPLTRTTHHIGRGSLVHCGTSPPLGTQPNCHGLHWVVPEN